MKIDFYAKTTSSIQDLPSHQIGKTASQLKQQNGAASVLRLAYNENPLGPSPAAISAAKEALLDLHQYPDSECEELKQSLAAFLKVNAQQITLGNGSENILELIVKAYLHKRGKAIISQYAFLTVPVLLQNYQVETQVVPVYRWGNNIIEMVRAIDEKTRALFLINPNNPTGSYTNEHDFHTLMNAVPAHVLVIIDEAYAEYVCRPDYPQTIKYMSRYPNLIVTRTFSKAYGLAALRLGFAVSSPTVAKTLDAARLPFNVNSIAVKAACAALKDQAHVQQSVLLAKQGTKQLEEGLRNLGLFFLPSVCNFMTVNVEDALCCYQELLQEGIIIKPLNAYQMPQQIRVTIGTHTQNERFLAAMKKYVSLHH